MSSTANNPATKLAGIVPGFCRISVLCLLAVACGVTALQAQTVVYVANTLDNTVSVIDTATNTATTSIAVGIEPVGVVFSPNGARAYVTNVGNASLSVSVIDTAQNKVVNTISLPGGGFPELPPLPAITPDGKRLYVPDFRDNTILVVDIATETVIATIPVATQPVDVAITPDGTRAYAVSFIGQAVSVIDTGTNTVMNSIRVGNSGCCLLVLAVAPDGKHVYVTSGGSALTVIDTATNTATISPRVELNSALAITPDGTRVYITDTINRRVSVLDILSNSAQADLISAGDFPFLIAITPDSGFAYVTNAIDNTVSVIATASNTVVATAPVGNEPEGIAILARRFDTFAVNDLDMNDHEVNLKGSFKLGSASTGLHLASQDATLTLAKVAVTIPAGSFEERRRNERFVFRGAINGVTVDFNLTATDDSGGAFNFSANIKGAALNAPTPVSVTLTIGDNTGFTLANAQ